MLLLNVTLFEPDYVLLQLISTKLGKLLKSNQDRSIAQQVVLISVAQV